jgi:triacylglycerol lipase
MISCSPLTNSDPRDLEVAAKAAQVPKGKVVLVPGIFDSRMSMRPLRKALVAGGYECLVPSLKPVDARRGIEPLARQLRDVIAREWRSDATFSIVAFSMGGLVSRHYLQKLGGAERCQGLYTIATPHNGSYLAYLDPGRGTKQMRPESAFLASLQSSEAALANLPVTSYRSPLDVVMLPTHSPKWPRAENVRYWAAIHPALLWEKELHADLLRRLGENAKK